MHLEGKTLSVVRPILMGLPFAFPIYPRGPYIIDGARFCRGSAPNFRDL